MDYAILLALLVSVAVNLYLVKAKTQPPSVFVNVPEIKNPVIEFPAHPTVVVQPAEVQQVIDYKKLEDILKRVALLMKQQPIDARPAALPAPTPQPQFLTAQNENTLNDGHQLYSSVEVEGISVRQFPRS